MEVAVLGAGLLGHAIAQDFAAYGADVRLYDVAATALGSARERMQASAGILVDLGVWSPEAARRSTRVLTTDDLATAVAGAELVVEAAPEDLEIKLHLLRRVEPLCAETAVIATNSSTFTAADLAPALRDPGRLVNAHYFNPPQLISVVEICASSHTRPEVVSWVEAALERHGKRPITLARPSDGFVANRLQAALLREASRLVADGVVTPLQLDEIVTGTIGRRLGYAGVFRTADLGGLDVFRALCDRLFPTLATDVQAPASLVDRVDQGQLGVKSGAGYYEYPDGGGDTWRSGMLAHLATGLRSGPAPAQ